MPPKTRARTSIGQRSVAAFEQASTRPETVRRGRGRPKGRGRSKIHPPPEAVDSTPALAPAPAPAPLPEAPAPQWAKDLKQTLETLVDLIAQNRTLVPLESAPGVQVSPPAPSAPVATTTFLSDLQTFRKFKPPRFSGVGSSLDAQQFLDQIERLWRVLECPETTAVKLVRFQLDGFAADWYHLWEAKRPLEGLSNVWDVFKTAFLRQFFPEGERYARLQEFLSLRQTEEMSVSEYAARFLHLSQFAQHVIPTEKDKARHFVNGLQIIHFKAIPITDDSTYEQVYNRAIELEIYHRESNQVENPSSSKKRPRFQPHSHKASSIISASPEQFERRFHPSIVSDRSPSGISSLPRSMCGICKRYHKGQCRKETGACFCCGKQGHMFRDCPERQTVPGGSKAHVTFSSVPPSSSVLIRSPTPKSIGRGTPECGHGTSFGAQARVYTLTRQDAIASNVDVTDSCSTSGA